MTSVFRAQQLMKVVNVLCSESLDLNCKVRNVGSDDKQKGSGSAVRVV